MFVRVINKNSETLYECDTVEIKQLTDINGEEADDFVAFELTLESRTQMLLLNKWENEVYIMNQNGRTIDSYRWHELAPRAVEAHESTVEVEIEYEDGQIQSYSNPPYSVTSAESTTKQAAATVTY